MPVAQSTVPACMWTAFPASKWATWLSPLAIQAWLNILVSHIQVCSGLNLTFWHVCETTHYLPLVTSMEMASLITNTCHTIPCHCISFTLLGQCPRRETGVRDETLVSVTGTNRCLVLVSVYIIIVGQD